MVERLRAGRLCRAIERAGLLFVRIGIRPAPIDTICERRKIVVIRIRVGLCKSADPIAARRSDSSDWVRRTEPRIAPDDFTPWQTAARTGKIPDREAKTKQWGQPTGNRKKTDGSADDSAALRDESILPSGQAIEAM
jgi:hypothetical protein